MSTLDWKNLGFGYMTTDWNARCYFKDCKWGEIEYTNSEYVNMHIAATCLHYGQEAFEGLKAYRCKDGKIRLFRIADNAQRMAETAKYIMMEPIPQDIFIEAVTNVVKKNEKFIPPYGSGASLYIRPLLIGVGPEIGVKPSKEYLFMVLVTPVGPYFKEGFSPANIMICRDYDRAAPLGTGHIKVGGNYAASLLSLKKGVELGYASVLYLDSREKKYIDECGQTNFFAIKGNTYITPESRSVLPSITNKSLMALAEDMGMKIERRRIPFEELATFDEAGSCGTAAVISPIRKIVDPDNNRIYEYCKDGKPGPYCEKLYNKLLAIQYGEEPDTHGWVTVL